MKREFAAQLRCPPVCGRGRSSCARPPSDEHEVREGSLRCGACASEFAVHRGVPELLHDPPEHVLKEAAGLERFATQMRAEGWNRELVRRLPNLEHGYWYVQARSMHQLLTTVPFAPGQSVLDVGSNTCWASNHFAERGLQAIALDIATLELQGLYTADWFFDDGQRVLRARAAARWTRSRSRRAAVDYVYLLPGAAPQRSAAGLRRTFVEHFACYARVVGC